MPEYDAVEVGYGKHKCTIDQKVYVKYILFNPQLCNIYDFVIYI